MPLPSSTSPVSASAPASRGRVRFGCPATGSVAGVAGPALALDLPVLAGRPDEDLLAVPAHPAQEENCTVFRTGDRLAGWTVAEPGADPETAARELYRRLFAVAGDLHLYRIWNYVPRINAATAGLENYRRFCRGRSLAFETRYGPDFRRHLPAGSAVGSPGGALAVAFVAGPDAPRHFENPLQVPAFEYPEHYGPRPPSFARATLAGPGPGAVLYLSGTAAIRGHASVAPGDLAGQLACTRENLARIAAAAGVDLAAPDPAARTFKIYLRHPADLPALRADLDRHLLRPADTVTILAADICRAELLVEIEAVLTLPTP